MNIKFKFLALFLAIPVILSSQSQDIKFERISIENGLPHYIIDCITQDNQGFMWFGTGAGLCRYDGYNLKVYKNKKNDKKGLIQNRINCLLVDQFGILWIGTEDLLKYNQISDNFTRFNYDKHLGSQINDIKEDRFGNLWLSINGRKLIRFDRKKKQFSNVLFSVKKDTVGMNFKINSILVSRNDVLWVATTRGLFSNKLPLPINNKSDLGQVDTVMFTEHYWDKVNRIPFQWTDQLYEDNKYNIWFTPRRGCLTRYSVRDNTFKHYPAEQKNKYSIRPEKICLIDADSNGRIFVSTGKEFSIFDQKLEKYVNRFNIHSYIKTYYLDRTGVMWFGTEYKGIFKISSWIKQFQQVWNFSTEAILEDEEGYIWLGGKSGLYKLNRKTGEYTHYEIERSTSDYQYKNHILSLCLGKNNQLWIGTQKGLFIYNQERQRFLFPTFSQKLYESAGISNWNIVYIDKSGSIWLANEQNTGLYFYDPENKLLARFSHDSTDGNSISSNAIIRVYQDSRDNIWIGTDNGLNKFDKSTKTFKRFNLATPGEIYRPSQIKIRDIIEQRNNLNGPMWICTVTNLYQFNRESGEFEECMLANGQIVDSNITGFFRRIAEDRSGNIWFSSHNGLGKYDTVNRMLKKYYSSDGFSGNQFYLNAHFKNKNGEMFFGSDNGCSAFFPDSIKDDMNIPQIVITNFKKLNDEVTLDSNITNLKQITLTHEENVFAFAYAALNFINPRKNQFAHKLEGFDKDWIYTGNKHDVTYTNIDPGEYTFHVKGSNSDGIWSEKGPSINIIILPPWWRTNMAYFAYLISGIVLVVILWRIQYNRIRLKRRLEIKNIESEKAKEIDQAKSRFFANISHEFRTPLTLIEGPVKQLLSGEFQGNIKEVYRLILRNTRQLLNLINQILDLAKLETGRLKLQASKQNVLPLISGLVQSFESLALRREIEFVYEKPIDDIEIYLDENKFEKIINNLLSNAFKYTPDKGRIHIRVSTDKLFPDNKSNSILHTQLPRHTSDSSEFLQISITNSGSYISPEQLEQIFERFYQVNESSVDHLEGTGIGLALVKELVELHHGDIDVESESERGTVFTVSIPMGKEHLAPEEIHEVQTSTGKESFTTEELGEDSEQKKNSINIKSVAEQKILIVEDNQDVRTYVAGLINSEYGILEAANGVEGFQIARKKNPDLIITDVMMPGLDGMEFCRQLKGDIEISHIPVIMLTARADLDDKLEGLEFGADDYIAKPFEARELRLRIRNVLDQRERLRSRFSQDSIINPRNITVTSVDEQFMKRLIDTIEMEMNRPDFSINEMADDMHMSRASLNRKIKALTNQPPSIVLRIIRLKKARELLQSGYGNVTEVAYEVGFQSMSYFSRVYLQQFGFHPSEEINSASSH